MNTELTSKVIDFLKQFYCLKDNEVAVKDGSINIYIHNINDFNHDYINAEFDTFYTVKYFTTDLIKMYQNHLKRFLQYFTNCIAEAEEVQECISILRDIKFRSQNMIWMKKKVIAEMLILDGHGNNYTYSIYNVGLNENPQAKDIREVVHAAITSRQMNPIKVLIDSMPNDVIRDFYRKTITHPTTKAIWAVIEANQKMHNLSFVFETEEKFLDVIQSSFVIKKKTKIYPIDLETGKRGKGCINLIEDAKFTKCSVFKFRLK